MKSRARITGGVWRRNVTWGNHGVWRTDMFKTVLADDRLQTAEFVCKNGPTVRIPAAELRRVLPLGADHYGGQIWGPFNIDPVGRAIDGRPVTMAAIRGGHVCRACCPKVWLLRESVRDERDFMPR